MIQGLIFDLDQTLVDSSIAEAYRSGRNWQKVYSLIPEFEVYSGFQEVFSFIQKKGIRTCIVTTSPGLYAQKVANHFQIPYEFIIDYFSTSRKKPSPDPMLKAIGLFGLHPNNILSLGDRAIDIQSSNGAGIKSVACLWGTNERTVLLASNPTYMIGRPNDILELMI